MDSKQAILGRIREALQMPAPPPGKHGDPHAGTGADSSTDFRGYMPPGGDSWEEQCEIFSRNAQDLKAEFHLLQDRSELEERLYLLSQSCGWKKVGSHAGALTTPAVEALKLPTCWTTDGYDVNDLESCDAGISECDALVAQTGSVLVTSLSAGGRALSVLPPHHVVLARREQMLPDLSAAYDLLAGKYATGYPSFMSFITGPSRTGDIERILVLGAHGPKRLTIFCV